MKCPLRNAEYHALDCWGTSCNFTDENGNCLIKAALETYINQNNKSNEQRNCAWENNPFLTFGDR